MLAPRVVRRCGIGRIALSHPRRALSSTTESHPIQFSYALSKHANDPVQRMLDDLTATPLLRNASKHDAALVLATPDFAKLVNDQDFVSHLTQTLSGSGSGGSFSILCGIVDHISPTLSSYTTAPGISVLRSHQANILPHLWQPEWPRSQDDADRVSALSFSLGSQLLTLPLARTTFQNGKTSTLIASQFNLSQSGPSLSQKEEARSQHAFLPIGAEQLNTGRLWAPMVPLTARRVLAESFGNIIRTIEVDGQPTPASTELESTVNTLYNQGGAAKLAPGGKGIWALVVPPADASALDSQPGPGSIVEDNRGLGELSLATTSYIQQTCSSGGRLYKILSGGGGWGAKKGLLSLDPQVSHFAFSEEEEMRRFMQTMDNSGFAPAGSTIQFFMSMSSPPPMPSGSPPSFVFGVSSQDPLHAEVEVAEEETCFIGAHFGALSNECIYLSSVEKGERTARSLADEMKLSVPHSRVFITNEKEGMSPLASAAAGSVADAGFLAMLL